MDTTEVDNTTIVNNWYAHFACFDERLQRHFSVITSFFNQSGFVKRRCEADSRWLPPDFSECVSKDYQTLFDKVKQHSRKNQLDYTTQKQLLSRQTLADQKVYMNLFTFPIHLFHCKLDWK